MAKTLYEHKEKHGLIGTPELGLWTSTLGLFAGLTTIVLYGVAGPEFKESLELSGALLGVLLSSPHLSKAFLSIPFGAWVDEVGGKKPFLILLGCSIIGLAGITGILFVYYPHEFNANLFPLLLFFGPLLGAFVDIYGQIGYAKGFIVFVILSTICAAISYGLKVFLKKK